MKANKVKAELKKVKEVKPIKPKRSEFYKFMNIVFSSNTWL